MTYTEPLLSLFLAGFAVWLWKYRRNPGYRGAVWGFVFMVLISWPPFDWLLARHLEAGYSEIPLRGPSTEAIVVLAGGVSPRQWGLPFERLGEDTVRRTEMGAWLFEHWGSIPILVSGGSNRLGGKPVAATMREYLERAGIPPGMIWTEERSRSTHENAVYSAEVLRQHGVKRIALVVDMQSMRRAEACFIKAGLEVVPAPSEHRDLETDSSSWFQELIPSWKSIRRNEITLHETLGLGWYWWRGYM